MTNPEPIQPTQDHTCPKCGRSYSTHDHIMPPHRVLLRKRKSRRCRGSGVSMVKEDKCES